MHDSSTNTVSRLKGSYNLFSPCRTSYNRTLFQVLFPDNVILWSGVPNFVQSVQEDKSLRQVSNQLLDEVLHICGFFAA